MIVFLVMQTTNRQGWQFVRVDYAKTRDHIENDIAKIHGIAIANVTQYLKGDKIWNRKDLW